MDQEEESLPPEDDMRNDGGQSEEEMFFNKFDVAGMDDKDPSLLDDYVKIYEKEVPFEIKAEGSTDSNSSAFEPLNCKILIKGDFNNPNSIKLELTCDKDLFFYYFSIVDRNIFNDIRSSQKLTCHFKDYGHMLIKYFEDCVRLPKTFMAIFYPKKDNTASMEFIENLEHKLGNLLKLEFDSSADEIVKKQISFRYSTMKAKDDLIKKKMTAINTILKDCDPQLIPEVKNAISTVKVDIKLRNEPLVNNHYIQNKK